MPFFIHLQSCCRVTRSSCVAGGLFPGSSPRGSSLQIAPIPELVDAWYSACCFVPAGLAGGAAGLGSGGAGGIGAGGAESPFVPLPGGFGLVRWAGGPGGIWSASAAGSTRRIRLTRNPLSLPPPLPRQSFTPLVYSQHQGGGNGCGQGERRRALQCWPSSQRAMGQLALSTVSTALGLAEG